MALFQKKNLLFNRLNIFFDEMKISKSKRSVPVYITGNLINLAIPFLLMPFLTRFLTPTDYGIIASFSILQAVMNPLIGLSGHGFLSNSFFQRDRKKILSSVLFASIGLSSILCATFIIFSFVFPEFLSQKSAVPKEILWLAPIMSLFDICILLLLTSLQITLKSVGYIVVQISRSSLNLGLSLLLVGPFSLGWEGRIYGQCLAAFITVGVAIVLLPKIWTYNGISRITNEIKGLLSFGVPLIPHSLSGIFVTMIDRYWVIHLVGLSAGGIYNAGYQIGSIISIIESSFAQAWQPWLYSQLSNVTTMNKKRVVRITYFYFIFLLSCSLVIAGLGRLLIPLILGKDFVGAGNYVIWVSLGFAFNGMYKMVVGYLFYFEKNLMLSTITGTCAILHIFISYFLVKSYGAMGAGFATSISFFLSFVFVWIASNKVLPMPWKLR